VGDFVNRVKGIKEVKEVEGIEEFRAINGSPAVWTIVRRFLATELKGSKKSKGSKSSERSMVQRWSGRSAGDFGNRVKGIKEVKEFKGIKEVKEAKGIKEVEEVKERDGSLTVLCW
ncbi:MAG: hypothetical protein JWN70_985, partial [Planctomycetaceae bacterium]|nr:hypothetical protein [Planctomycetaceae bacterium]